LIEVKGARADAPETRGIMAMVRLLLALLLLAAAGARGQDAASTYPQARAWFPEAERFGAFEGEPRAAAAYADAQVVGYLFLTSDVVRIPAYSGHPITSLVGFDLAGRIRGVAVVEHQEPILAVGVSEAQLRAFSDQYRGKRVFDRVAVGAERPGHVQIDTISGATITVMVQNQTLMSAARRVAESRGLAPGGGAPAAAAPGQASAAAQGPAAATASGKVPWTAARVDGAPLWRGVWEERRFRIAVLVAGLVLLNAILLFQDWFARRPRLLERVRRAFLLYTVFFIGWYGLAQLSVVQVLTFVHAVMAGFQWETFLIDPMIFILWSFVAFSLLLWGRGVYCGWLCPFGALQELVQQLARRFNFRQLEFPDVVHERLWGLKYIILIALFGISLQSMGDAVRYAEVEPFKTAITLRFDREWPFVLYAAGLIVVSAFNRKLFCKYLCPLGAALSIPGRFRVFDWWLRRRKECGRPCQTCHNLCEVRAIRPTGEINANECHYCLDCQITYYSDRRCLPLIERREKREQRAAARAHPIKLVRNPESPKGSPRGPL
jgi:polyferredoxin/Na+-translocating ferredoxin:NAD+ oxidoreductase RnfG subunit